MTPQTLSFLLLQGREQLLCSCPSPAPWWSKTAQEDITIPWNNKNRLQNTCRRYNETVPSYFIVGIILMVSAFIITVQFCYDVCYCFPSSSMYWLHSRRESWNLKKLSVLYIEISEYSFIKITGCQNLLLKIWNYYYYIYNSVSHSLDF